MKLFLSHIETKRDLTAYLAKKVLHYYKEANTKKTSCSCLGIIRRRYTQ